MALKDRSLEVCSVTTVRFRDDRGGLVGRDGTMTTLIAQSHANGFLFVWGYETSGIWDPYRYAEELVASIVVVAEIIQQTSGIFERISQSVIRQNQLYIQLNERQFQQRFQTIFVHFM